jgi:hypothetical protein
MDPIQKYFYAERFESLIFMGVGAAAIVLALYGWFYKADPLWKGIAYPLVIIGLIQIAVGSTVFFRTPSDILRVTEIVEKDSDRIRSEELPRMEAVLKNFVTIRYVEIAMVGIGAVLIIIFGGSPFWKGVGAGLAVQAAVSLLLDFFAEKRGHEYFEYLKTIS